MVSIIIPCLNHFDMTLNCLKSIYQWTDMEKHEIIIIDDASDDTTKDFVACTLKYNYKISRHWPNNWGFGPSVNEGIKMASGDFIAVFNNDFLVGPMWLDNLLKGIDMFDCDMVTSWLVGSGHCPVENFDDWATAQWPTQKHEILYWDKGGPWFFKKSVFDRIGLFDEQFQYGQYEDVDMLLRMAKNKMKWGMYKRSICFHYGSVTQHGELKNRVGTDYIAQNAEKFRTKWNTCHITPARVQAVYDGEELPVDGR